MKKSKFTIAVLSACMLAATGGISLGAAALANAPEAIKAPESSLVAGQVISDGIKVKREASRDGNSITLTYSVTPSYASNINVSASLSWNGANPNNRVIGNYLTMTHNAETKTVVVTKTSDFDVPAKVVITDSVSNVSATVQIDCIQSINFNDVVDKNINIDVDELKADYDGDYESGIVVNSGANGFYTLSSLYTIASDPKVTAWELSYKYYFSDSSTFDQTMLSQENQADRNFVLENYEDVNDQDRAENIHTNYGIGRLWLDEQEITHWFLNSNNAKRFLHLYATIEAEIEYNAAVNIDASGDACEYVDFSAHWCIDGASLFQASALTAETGHIYF